MIFLLHMTQESLFTAGGICLGLVWKHAVAVDSSGAERN